MSRSKLLKVSLITFLILHGGVNSLLAEDHSLEVSTLDQNLHLQELNLQIKRAENHLSNEKNQEELCLKELQKLKAERAKLENEAKRYEAMNASMRGLYHKETKALGAEGFFYDQIQISIKDANNKVRTKEAECAKIHDQTEESSRILKTANQRLQDYEQAIKEGWKNNPF